MSKQTLSVKALRCYSDIFLCCGALTRCRYPSSPCDYHRISRRRFGSGSPRLKPEGAAAESDGSGDQNGARTTSSWRSANWVGPRFKRRSTEPRLTGEESELRKSLFASQKSENPPIKRDSAGHHVRFVGAPPTLSETPDSQWTVPERWVLSHRQQDDHSSADSQSQIPRQQRQSDRGNMEKISAAFPARRSGLGPESSSETQPCLNGRTDAHPSQIRHPMSSSVLRPVVSGAHAGSRQGQGQEQGFSAQQDGQLGMAGTAHRSLNLASSYTQSLSESDPSSLETDTLSVLEKPLHTPHQPAVQRQDFSATQLNGRMRASVSANGSLNSALSDFRPVKNSGFISLNIDTLRTEEPRVSAPRQPSKPVGNRSEPKHSNNVPERGGQRLIGQNQFRRRKDSHASARESIGMFNPATPLGWAAPQISASPDTSSIQSPNPSNTSDISDRSSEPESLSAFLAQESTSSGPTSTQDRLSPQSLNPSTAPEISDRPSRSETPFGWPARGSSLPESKSRREHFNQQTSNQQNARESSEMLWELETLSDFQSQDPARPESLNSQDGFRLQSSDQSKAPATGDDKPSKLKTPLGPLDRKPTPLESADIRVDSNSRQPTDQAKSPETSDDHSKPKTLSGWTTPRFSSHSTTSSGWGTPRFRSRPPTLTSWESSQRDTVVNTQQPPPAEKTHDQTKTRESSSSNKEDSSEWTTHDRSQHEPPAQNGKERDTLLVRKHAVKESNHAKVPKQAFDPGAYNQPHFPNFRPVLENSEPQLSKEHLEIADTKAKVNEAPKSLATEIDESVDEEAGQDSNSQRSDKQSRKVEYVDHKKLRQEFKSKKSLAFNEDDFDDFDETPRRGKRKGKGKNRGSQKAAASAEPTPIHLPEFISVSNLADALSQRKAAFLGRIQDLGFEDATYDHVLDAETAGLIAAEFNFEPVVDTTVDDLVAAPIPDDTSNLSPRPPVVTIMGHVDHGKTTILDWLRKSSVAASEHGGITQHIGAFSVKMPTGKMVTFLDTPGHAAFLDMRRRGADVTDIVILVVAADDSVKPQTLEAIKHANEARVPIIVAISKIDKPEINVERVKQDLARHGVNVEDFGGDVQTVGVSGKTGQGMLDLEEAAVTLAETLDLRADTAGNTEGWVVEAATQKGGRVATVLVRRGTLRPGSVVVAGKTWARIRNLRNEAGVQVQEATPGTPVAIDGWREQPMAGDEVLQAESEQRAKEVIELRLEKEETQKMGGDMQAINESRRIEREKRQQALTAEEEGLLGEAAATSERTDSRKTIPFIVKADVSGSVEAVVNSISGIGNGEVYPTILRASAGKVSEFDIKHASVAKGTIVTFNERTDQDILKLAAAERVDVVDHTIIYELIDDVKARLSEKLAPNITHRVLGEAEIAQVFEFTIRRRETTLFAGCRVTNGTIARSHRVKVSRKGEIIYDGTLSSLKNVRKDVTEMRKGTECGIGFDSWTGFEVGDQIQAYEEIREKRYL